MNEPKVDWACGRTYAVTIGLDAGEGVPRARAELLSLLLIGLGHALLEIFWSEQVALVFTGLGIVGFAAYVIGQGAASARSPAHLGAATRQLPRGAAGPSGLRAARLRRGSSRWACFWARSKRLRPSGSCC